MTLAGRTALEMRMGAADPRPNRLLNGARMARPDTIVFAKLSAPLQYVDGDYNDVAPCDRLKLVLGDAARPILYLALPPGPEVSYPC